MFYYFLFANLYIAVFACIYYFIIRGTNSFKTNKIFIILFIFMGLMLPAFNEVWEATADYRLYNIMDVATLKSMDYIYETQPLQFSIVDYFTIYKWIVGVMLIIYGVKSMLVYVQLKKYKQITLNDTTVLINTNIGPGSIFNKIIIPNDTIQPEIFAHEKAHISYHHFEQKVAINILCILFFPVLPLYYFRKEWLLINEYEADKKAAYDKTQYVQLLLSNTLATKTIFQFNSFFHNPIKLRIMMLQNEKKTNANRTILTAVMAIAIIATFQTFSLAQQVVQKQKIEEDVFRAVDEMPKFDGDLMQYLSENIKYPDTKAEGRVIIEFVINKDGSVGNLKLMRGVNKALDKEAMRVVKNMPKWTPGKQNGEPMAVYYTLPIRFKRK